MIWTMDANCHHPLWDRDEDTDLFTPAALRRSQGLIDLLGTYDMDMVLPKDIPTLQHQVSRRWTRPDNIFVSEDAAGLVTQCTTAPHLRGP
ncbi:hypothetical protein K523DRAFT_223733, partial [Schizophyllum commune Tattone D]